MLAPQRHARILEELRRTGAVRVAGLVERLGVSDVTVRRDLEALSRTGRLRKVHGGAVPPAGTSTEEPPFSDKSACQEHEKESIARAAAALVEPGSAVALTGGSTTWLLARRLCDVPGLSVVTNSVQVADAFHGSSRGDRTVLLTGGVRTPADALVGPVAVAAMRGINVDLTFLGVHGMHERKGFTTPNLAEGDINRAMADAAAALVVVADHTKWGLVGLRSVAELDEADVLVTDGGIDAGARAVLADRVGELVVAGPVPAAPDV